VSRPAGIAEAEHAREMVRVRFEAEVAHRITAVDVALEHVTLRRARLALLTERAAPAASKALRMADQGLRSGVIGALRYLVVARAERAVRLDLIDAEQAVLEAWCELESATGAPLLRFPSTSVESAKRAESEGEAR
jgi:outer membrane protein TolC